MDRAAAAPLLSFGIVADVQFADVDDAFNYDKTRLRYYRDALHKLADCVKVEKG